MAPPRGRYFTLIPPFVRCESSLFDRGLLHNQAAMPDLDEDQIFHRFADDRKKIKILYLDLGSKKMQFPLGEKDTEGSFRREIRTGGNLP